MQLYSGKYGIYNNKNDKTLLMLAMKQNNTTVAEYLLNKNKEYDDYDKNDQNVLDYYIQTTDGENANCKLIINNSLQRYIMCMLYDVDSDILPPLRNSTLPLVVAMI